MKAQVLGRTYGGAAAVRWSRVRLALCAVTALAVLVSGIVHLWLYFDGFSGIRLIGPMFLLNAVAGLVIAVALLVWRSWLPAFLAAGFGAATFAGYLISRTVGLFGVHEVVWDLSSVLAAVAEVVALVGGALVLLGDLRRAGG